MPSDLEKSNAAAAAGGRQDAQIVTIDISGYADVLLSKGRKIDGKTLKIIFLLLISLLLSSLFSARFGALFIVTFPIIALVMHALYYVTSYYFSFLADLIFGLPKARLSAFKFERFPEDSLFLKGLNTTISEFRGFLARHEFAVSAPPAEPVRSRRWPAAGLYGLGLAVVLMAMAIGAFLPRPLAELFVFLGMGAALWILILARRMGQLSADDTRRQDKRPPAVLSRAFSDEKAVLRRNRHHRNTVSRGYLFCLEEALAPVFSIFGPFVAIGEPGEKVPELGAARAYLPDADWQTVYGKWVADARLVAFIPSDTPNLGWELKFIVSNGHVAKTLFLMHSGHTKTAATWVFGNLAVKRSRPSNQKRWDAFAKCFENTKWEKAAEALDVADCLVAVPRPSGQIVSVHSRTRFKEDYELAVLIGAYAALGHADLSPADRRTAPVSAAE